MSRRFLPITSFSILLVLAAFIAGLGCHGDSTDFASPLYHPPGHDPYATDGVYITGIVVQPAGVNLVVGAAQQFRALATYNDGTTLYVTNDMEWFTENPAVGSFEMYGGKFHVLRPGIALIRCRTMQAGVQIVSTVGFINAYDINQDLPPSVPQNPRLAATPEGVLVSWDPNVGDSDVIGYNIYRTQTYGAHYASDFGRVNIRPVLYPSHLDGTVVSGWYYYRVTAQDYLGVQSAPSEEASVFITGESHYTGAYDGGTTFADEQAYKDAFSTVF